MTFDDKVLQRLGDDWLDLERMRPLTLGSQKVCKRTRQVFLDAVGRRKEHLGDGGQVRVRSGHFGCDLVPVTGSE